MGRLLENPILLIGVVVLALLLFGAPKLPAMARSLGQSMRIFKSEVKQLQSDDATTTGTESPSITPSKRENAAHAPSEPPAPMRRQTP